MKARFFIFIGLLLLKSALASHPVHVSIVNMDLSTDSNRIDYSVCLYYEDFQSLINYKYNTLIDFRHQSRMTTKEQNSILEYIDRTLILKSKQNKSFESEFVNWKIEDDLLWLFFCINEFKDTDSLIIENRLMLDLFGDQKNLLILKIDDREEGFEFNKRNFSYTVKLGNE